MSLRARAIPRSARASSSSPRRSAARWRWSQILARSLAHRLSRAVRSPVPHALKRASISPVARPAPRVERGGRRRRTSARHSCHLRAWSRRAGSWVAWAVAMRSRTSTLAHAHWILRSEGMSRMCEHGETVHSKT
eukprot:scaffold37353_cov2876-Isochrysis_galbana.AAC.1